MKASDNNGLAKSASRTETSETSNGAGPRILTRIYITPEGDLVVTDLWDEVRGLLRPHFGEVSDE
jgi:hypothetical protein